MAKGKKKTEKKPRMGRPKIEINMFEFDKLCQIHATLIEIAGWFNCSEDTIENYIKKVSKMTFSEYYKNHQGKGKISLRRKQYQAAMDGNITMLIWLGKQWLGQRDKTEHEHGISDGFSELLKEIGGSGTKLPITNPKS